jgi:cobalt/nickel transport system permease protein
LHDVRAKTSHRKRNTVRRALAGFGEAIAREMAGEVRSESRLSRIEPRAKVVGFLVLIVAATLLQGLIPLALLLLGVTAAVLMSGISFRRLGRMWLGVPLFTLAIALPAMLNVVTPGAPAVSLFDRIGPWTLPVSITWNGLIVAGRFLLRSTTCVTLAFLLVSTTDRAALLNGLRRLGMPKAFGMVLSMMQRYLSVLIRSAEEIHLAKLSRTIGEQSLRQEQHWVAAGIGSLFRRTYRLAQETHSAMVARGFDGETRIAPGAGFRPADVMWGAGIVLVVGAFLIIDRTL